MIFPEMFFEKLKKRKFAVLQCHTQLGNARVQVGGDLAFLVKSKVSWTGLNGNNNKSNLNITTIAQTKATVQSILKGYFRR